MRTSTLFATVLLAAATATAAPIHKRALTLTAYNDMSISSGVGGDAENRANAIWTKGLTGITDVQTASDDALAAVSDDDLDILKVERENAEAAETDAFNPAIDAADGDAADALQVGKTANKVLKLTGLALVRKIGIAKKTAAGDAVSSSDEAALEDTLTKLTKNIATDVENEGKPSTAVDFVGQTSVKA
ncbi:hypothetical protein Dda_6094 [Drechslerella dactyloides]|uniref:Small secreted protein n=1 Tax=Drechslerella dactyloides TaxID=74499 RepID=A0AAD6NGY1_DREDA|nr:hypothetical protein Dda_6094 [Drechslerella dactyloides]